MSDSASVFPDPNSFTKPLFDQLKRHPKRIVFTEAEDPRIVRVAARMVEMELGIPVLLGNREKILAIFADLGLSTEFVRIIDPAESSDFELFCERFERIERYRGIVNVDAESIIAKPHYFAAMMVQYGQADAYLGGNQVDPFGVFRPVLHLVKPCPSVEKAFACTVLVSNSLPNFGANGILFLADTGLIAEPEVDDIAAIAAEAGKLAHLHLGRMTRVALLSHSNYGSARDESSRMMQAAAALANERVDVLDIDVDGEIQADVALVPKAAAVKVPELAVKPPSDVLIFPSLDAAHISLKLLRHLGGAQAYGKIICGLNKPAAQVPRTACEEMILGTAAALGVEAIKSCELHPSR